MSFIARLLISSAAVLLSSYLIDGVIVDGFLSALLVALFLGLLNVLLKPILVILTIPITVLSFGLFLLVINALLVLMVNGVVTGFTVDGFWPAILFSVVLSLMTFFLDALFNTDKPRE